jgi:AcrR family transcriptional regulator
MDAISSNLEQPIDARILRTHRDILGAVMHVLLDEGFDAVTHPHVARVAGYSKATVYAHWPERIDLIRDAFARFADVTHHQPTGTLRDDLIGELKAFCSVITDHHLDRVLAILAERAHSVPEVAEIRDRFVAEGERPLRELLAGHVRGDRLEAATLMCSGTIIHSALMHGHTPGNNIIEYTVDTVLAGIESNR